MISWTAASGPSWPDLWPHSRRPSLFAVSAVEGLHGTGNLPTTLSLQPPCQQTACSGAWRPSYTVQAVEGVGHVRWADDFGETRLDGLGGCSLASSVQKPRPRPCTRFLLKVSVVRVQSGIDIAEARKLNQATHSLHAAAFHPHAMRHTRRPRHCHATTAPATVQVALFGLVRAKIGMN